ncbi:AbrB/MazE/SpoVT family DNA-binding domain-containing protein, partial [Aerosakkonemataceae cyanobacterium BLCC-F50]
MLSATVTETGQITLPQEIRDRLKLVSGSKINFIIDEDDYSYLRMGRAGWPPPKKAVILVGGGGGPPPQ